MVLGRMRPGRLLPSPTPSSNRFPQPRSRAHQGELVGDLAIGWQLGSKAVGREELVAVVVLDDLPDGLECQGVCAQLVGAGVVQRGGLRWQPCGTAHISTHMVLLPGTPPLLCSPLEAVKSMATVKFSCVLGGRVKEAASPRHSATPQPSPAAHPTTAAAVSAPPGCSTTITAFLPPSLGSLGAPGPTHPPRM